MSQPADRSPIVPSVRPSDEPVELSASVHQSRPDTAAGGMTRRGLLHVIGGAAAGVMGYDLLFHDRARMVRAAGATAEDKAWGTVKGRIVWGGEGDPPAPQQIDLSKYRLNEADLAYFQKNGPVYNEEWIVKKENKGVRWVFVWMNPLSLEEDAELAVAPQAKEIKNKTVKMEQPASGFVPHSVALREGQDLEMVNNSPIFHSVTWAGFGPGANGNTGMQPNTSFAITKLRADPAPITIACAPHPWEKAWLRVFAHPCFAVTDADGKFEIPLVPAGEQRIKVWQESAGLRGGKEGRKGEVIKVAGGGVTDLGDLVIKPKPATTKSATK